MRVTEHLDEVLSDVRLERERQFRKFGDENFMSTGTDSQMLACLAEEFGEVAKEVCEGEMFGHDTDGNLYKELIQVAAVASGMAERMRRDGRVMPATARPA